MRVPAEPHVAAAWRDKILHARMTVGEDVLMGSDAPPDRWSIDSAHRGWMNCQPTG